MSTSFRNTAVDAIRVFALIGICVVNLPYHALAPDAAMAMPTAPVDRLAAIIVGTLFEAKFFLIFSFLFGWSLAVQEGAATRAGASPLARHLRRIAGLAAIGLAHALLVYSGDILVLYALLGLLIWPLRSLTPRRLVQVAAATIPLSLAALTVLASSLEGAPPLAASHAGSFADAVEVRIADWPGTFHFLVLFQGPLAFGAFALGIAAAKSGFFEPASAGRRSLSRWLPLLLGLGLPLNLFFALATLTASPTDAGLLPLLGLLAVAPGAPLLSAAYLAGFLALADRYPFPPLLQLAGRNSLTAYILQGVIAGLVFGGWGLGLFAKLGAATLLPVSLTVALASFVATGLLARLLGRGPLEILLRFVTNGGDAVARPA